MDSVTIYLIGSEINKVLESRVFAKMDVIHSGYPCCLVFPKCSILGPIRFLLYVTDIHSSLSDITNLALFSDDAKIYRKTNCIDDCSALQTQEMENEIQYK